MSVRVLPERLYQGGKTQGERRQWHPVGGVHPWLNDKDPAWSQMSASLYLSASRLRILRSHWPHAPDSSLYWWPLSCWFRSRAPASPSSLKLLLVKVFGHGHGKNNCVKMGKFKGHRIFHCTNNGSKEPPQLSKHTEGNRGDLWRWRRRGEEITLDRKKARQSCFEEEADTLRWATWNKIDIGLRDESSFATQWLKTFPGYRICQALGHRNVLYQRTMTLSREVRKEQERVTGKKTSLAMQHTQ